MNGIANGFTVKATGKNENNETTDYAAGGFYGQANSTKTRESHVTNLKSVTADTSTSDGIAGGFVGFSTTGGLADALSNADDSSVLDNLIKGGLLSVNDLLGAMPYLIPSYTDTTVSYVNGGYVEGDIAEATPAISKAAKSISSIRKISRTTQHWQTCSPASKPTPWLLSTSTM